MTLAATLAGRSTGAPPILISDFSPPRGANLLDLRGGDEISPDYYCVAYAPGRAVRPDPFAVAAALRARTGRPSIANLATRDANVLALSNTLMGAYLLGVRDVVVLAGDEFGGRDLSLVQAVRQVSPTGLIRQIVRLNEGIDFRGAKLLAPTSFSVGATVDLGRGVEHEVVLARRKIEAGAMFLLTQPIYDAELFERFVLAYAESGGPDLPPVVVGIDVPATGSVSFAAVPEWVKRDLAAGRTGAEIALEVATGLRPFGVPAYYVVPTILRGGARDYAGAAPVIEALRAG
ncbi:MAG: methylenetetrahydrofolate reductase [Dehalococcoidia bacterium]